MKPQLKTFSKSQMDAIGGAFFYDPLSETFTEEEVRRIPFLDPKIYQFISPYLSRTFSAYFGIIGMIFVTLTHLIILCLIGYFWREFLFTPPWSGLLFGSLVALILTFLVAGLLSQMICCLAEMFRLSVLGKIENRNIVVISVLIAILGALSAYVGWDIHNNYNKEYNISYQFGLPMLMFGSLVFIIVPRLAWLSVLRSIYRETLRKKN